MLPTQPKALHHHMKKLIISTLLLAVLSSISFVAQGQPIPDSAFLAGFSFRNLGPTRGGRVTAVEGVVSQPGTFYQGATGAGVWKTTDYGLSWENVSDGYFATPSIGAIAVAPRRPDRVYVGTGSDGLRSNVISGKGIYRSDNAGHTWQHVGLTATGHIGAVEVHPEHPDTVFVAAIGQAFSPNSERGVYRSYDGGDTWEKVLFLADTVGFADLELAPDDPQTVYAAAWRAERKPWTIISGGLQGGIYKSTDGGDTWKQLGGGLPGDLIGKIDLAVSPAEPDLLYALVEAPADTGGLYVSHDRGESFARVSDHAPLLDRPFYYCNVDVNPQNPRSVYVSATQFWHSADGGKTWNRKGTPHGDNHDLWIHPQDTLLMIQCNDGGANVTQNGGKSWSTQHNQPTAELYQVEVDDQYPYWLYAGQQDNTTLAVPSRPPYPAPGGYSSYWQEVGGCETGPVVPKPGKAHIVYANCKGRFGVYNKLTGQEQQYYVGAANMYGHNPRDLAYRFQRVSPIHVSPHDPDVVYHTSQFVHKTTDEGQTWEQISPDLTAFEPDKQVISGAPITRDVTGEEFYSTIYSIRESPVQAGVIWVGANDGPVHVTRNGGKDWALVTPPSLPPGGRVDAVEPSPHQAGKAYISVLRYQLGDWKPYIFKTEDFGSSWELLTPGDNGIPRDFPTRVVREDPIREGLLYAGTEYGLFLSMDEGQSWQPFQASLPVVPITDIKVFRGDLILSTMGRGFWLLDNLSPLHQWGKGQAEVGFHFFHPRDEVRSHFRSNGPQAVPHYPPVGVVFDYYLEDSLAVPLSYDIVGPEGKVVASFSSGDSLREAQSGEVDMRSGFRAILGGSGLPTHAGMHRLRWNMRHTGPWRDGKAAPGSGPWVKPGTYTLQVKLGDKALIDPFAIHIDPRIREQGIHPDELAAQEALALQVRDLQSQAHRLAHAVKVRQDTLAKGLEAGDAPALQQEADRLQAIDAQLHTAEGRYMTPMLIDQLSYLSYMINAADQRPGKDAYERYSALKQSLDGLIQAAKQLDLNWDAP